jgi:hypothetical protein
MKLEVVQYIIVSSVQNADGKDKKAWRMMERKHADGQDKKAHEHVLIDQTVLQKLFIGDKRFTWRKSLPHVRACFNSIHHARAQSKPVVFSCTASIH